MEGRSDLIARSNRVIENFMYLKHLYDISNNVVFFIWSRLGFQLCQFLLVLLPKYPCQYYKILSLFMV